MKSFQVSLKEQRDLWYLSIMEMWAGQQMSHDLSDQSVAEQAAQNVLLMETYARR